MAVGPEADHDLRERSVSELVKQLADQTSTLVRQEMDLAKAELTQKGQQAGKGAGLIGAAAVIGLLGAGALTAFLIMLLDGALANWLAALIVAVVFIAIAGILALQGKKKVQAAAPPVPEQTVETVKEDVEWAKTRTGSAQR
jgi:MFS family permease